MPVQYQDGKIYKIVNGLNDSIYIGSTCQTLATRMAGHRYAARRDASQRTPWEQVMAEMGTEHFKIVLIHAFPCKSKDELEAEEYKVLDDCIKAGITVHNTIIAGKQAATSCAKRSATRKARGEVGDKCPSFDFGTVCFCQTSTGKEKRWVFRAKTPAVSKSFSVLKYGHWQAKLLAEAERKKVYPKWNSDEEAAINAAMTIQWD